MLSTRSVAWVMWIFIWISKYKCSFLKHMSRLAFTDRWHYLTSSNDEQRDQIADFTRISSNNEQRNQITDFTREVGQVKEDCIIEDDTVYSTIHFWDDNITKIQSSRCYSIRNLSVKNFSGNALLHLFSIKLSFHVKSVFLKCSLQFWFLFSGGFSISL